MAASIPGASKRSAFSRSGAGCACVLSLLLVHPAGAACIDVAQPEALAFQGTLSFRIFPGPPAYADVRNGDAPEPGYILKLDEPICALAGQALLPDRSFDEIELVASDSFSDKALSGALRHLIGQRISVEGHSTFAPESVHHHALLMLSINSVSGVCRIASRHADTTAS